MSGPVVVGLGTRNAGSALVFAHGLARALNAELVAVHAVEAALAFPYGDRSIQELHRRSAIAHGRRFVRRVERDAGVVVGETRVVLGEPVAALRAVARELEAAFVVVAPRRRRRLAHALAAGTSGRLAASSPCPVVVVPPDGKLEPGRLLAGAPIVVGTNGSPESRRAVVVADALSERLDLPVLPVGIDVAEQAAAGSLRYRNVHRRPGHALAEIARRARSGLLVVGTAGGSRLSGSVAQWLIAATPVPLVVVSAPKRHG